METTSPAAESPSSHADSNPSLSRVKFGSPVSARHKPVAKKYGRAAPLPVQNDGFSTSSDATISSDASVQEIPETLAMELGGGERHSTSVVPETDPEIDQRGIGRIVMEGESQDSGPPSSDDHSNRHTTDPTSEDEADRLKGNPVQSSPTPPAFGKSVASSDGEEDTTIGASGWQRFMGGKSVKDILNDDEDEDDEPPKKSAPPILSRLQQTNLRAKPSSSLASLTSDSAPSSTLPALDDLGLIPLQRRKIAPIIPSTSLSTLESSPTTQVFSRALPPTTAHSPAPALFGDIDSEEEESVKARPRSTNTKKRIVTSDGEDESEGGFIGMHHSLPSQFIPTPYSPPAHIPNPFDPPAVPLFEDEEEDLPADIREAAPVLSTKERLELMAAKKRAAMPAPVEERERSVESVVEDSSEDEKEKRRARAVSKPRKHREDSRKAVDELNRGTAAAIRSTAVGLERRDRPALDVRKMTAKAALLPITAHGKFDTPRLSRPTPPPPPPRVIPSDPIVSSSISLSATPRRQTGLSERARGKLPESSSSVEIVPSTFRPVVETQDTQEEEEEDLPTLEEIGARAIAKKKADAYLAMKIRAASAQRSTTVVLDDSDDDLEIEERPVARKETTVADASQFPRRSITQRKFQDLRGTAGAHRSEEATDSQLLEAGHTFGTNLGPARVVSVSNFERKKSVKTKKVSVHHGGTIDGDQLAKNLMGKVRLQNAAKRTDKLLRSRRNDTGAIAAKKEEDEAVDMSGMLERKKMDLEKGDAEEEDEDADDGDFELVGDADSAHSGDDAGGSGSEVEDIGSSSNVENEDSDGEENVVKVRSTEGREPLGEIQLSKDDDNKENEIDEEGDETMMPASPPRRSRAIVDDDESQDTQSVSSAHFSADVIAAGVPGKVQLPSFMQGNDDAGFSQFFGTAFSQDVGGDNQVEGFNRAPEIDLPDSTYLAPPLINNAERALDAARLDAMNAFRHNALDTPRIPAPARKYINKQGFMTQTRPANPYEESPRDERLAAGSYEQSSYQDSFTPSQTQLESPTKTYLDDSCRLGPLGSVSEGKFDSQGPTPTQIEESQDSTQIDSQAIPSAQPHRAAQNAFEIMRAAQTTTTTRGPTTKSRAAPNAFVDDQAHLSDEEVVGMGGGGSGDEDETLEDLDADLEGMVDHEKIDAETEARQDALVREQVARDAAADDLARQTRAQRMIDGKERGGKRKAGNLDLSDDEFDDDGYGISRRDGVKQKRVVENPTMTELEANEETQAFAHSRRDGLTVIFKDDEHSNLTNVAESSDDDEDDTPPISVQESRRLAGEMSRRRKESTSFPQEQTITIHSSSPPPRQPRLNNRTSRANLVTAPLPRVTESFDDIDSQYSNHKNEPLTEQQKRLYVQDTSKAESQNTSGQTGGAGSAVTGYRQSNGATKATYGKSLEGGKGGKAVAAPKTNKFKRSKFAK